MNTDQRQIVIIGGGITGLSAAFYLQKEIQEKGLPWNVTLLESKDQLGGKIQTITRDNFVMERGPDSFLERKNSALELVKELGIQSDLVRNKPEPSFILRKGRLLPIPEGAVMGVPTKWLPFATTQLLSPFAKIRAAADLILPQSKHWKDEDQSVGSFFRSRLGAEVVDQIIEPLLSGIFAGDIDQMSLMTTFPQFAEMRKKHRSLLLGMKTMRPPKQTSSKPQGMFLTLKNGLYSMVEALENQLTQVSIRKNTTVQQIEKTEDGYTLHLQDQKSLYADHIIITTPHDATRKVFGNPDFLTPLHDRPTSVATVILAFPQEAMQAEHSGTGFLIPRSEKDFTITACTWTHKKWPHTTPAGKTLLRCYVGRPGNEEIVSRSDEEIVETVIQDLRKITTFTAEPDFTYVTRWRRGMSQFLPNHQTWLQEIREKMNDQYPGIQLAGASYESSGIPDCITQGKQAVDKLVRDLS